MRILTLLFFAYLGFALPPALAQQSFLPSLHSVRDVAQGDVLNVRAEPDGGADIVGSLEADATGIEVIALNETGKWGKVGLDESGGWVSMRFLEPEPVPENVFEAGMSCFGTEPFWSLELSGLDASFSLHGDRVDGLSVAGVQPANIIRNYGYAFDLTAPNRTFSGFVQVGACSDGMSDRDFGWRTMLLMRDGAELKALQGCCSLQQN